MKKAFSLLLSVILLFTSFCFVGYAAKVNISLSDTAFVYDGKTHKPAVKVYLGGKKLTLNEDYIISYPKSSKNIGSYTLSISFIGSDIKTKKECYSIIPSAPKGISVTSQVSKIKIKYNKVSAADGYEIEYSSNKSFSNKKTTATKNTTFYISNLNAEKTFYVRVRSYTIVNGSKIYSKYTDTKNGYIKITDKITVNVNSKVFHINSSCYAVKRMSTQNKKTYTCTVKEIKKNGYKACGICSNKYK